MMVWSDVLAAVERYRSTLRECERSLPARGLAKRQRLGGRWSAAAAARLGGLLVCWGTRLQRYAGVSGVTARGT